MEKMRRRPARLSRIKDMGQGRVSVVGTIIKKEPNEFLLDDGSGQAPVLLQENIPFTAGNIIRVIGRAFSGTIEAEIVQDMSDLDIKYYTKMMELKDRAEQKLSRVM